MITKIQKEKINSLGKKHKLDFIILYGSQAKKRANKLSDIDLAIYRRGGIKPKEYFQIFNQFFKIFASDKIDLKLLHNVDPLYRFQVTQTGKLLYGNITEYNSFKAFAYRSYQDAKPLFKLEKHLLDKFFNK